MNQQKYLVYAFLLLLVVAGTYFIIQKFSQTKVVDNSSSRIIDYDESVDSLPKSHSEGKKLYQSKCMSCHGSFAKTDGPRLSLAGVNSRWPDKKELFAFIRNPAAVMSRNAYVRKLKAKYGSLMTAFSDLTDKQIQAILNYIKSQETAQQSIIP